MTYPNQGAADLVAALAATEPKPTSLYKAARDLGISDNYLSRLVAADSTTKPSRTLAISLMDRFGVDVRAWDKPYKPSAKCLDLETGSLVLRDGEAEPDEVRARQGAQGAIGLRHVTTRVAGARG